MTRALGLAAAPLLLGAALIAQPAAAEPGQRAVSQCRAEMLNHFPAGAVRNYRVADISGNSRRTRVTIHVTADQRYTFECAASADGRILTASFNPPRSGTQSASAAAQR